MNAPSALIGLALVLLAIIIFNRLSTRRVKQASAVADKLCAYCGAQVAAAKGNAALGQSPHVLYAEVHGYKGQTLNLSNRCQGSEEPVAGFCSTCGKQVKYLEIKGCPAVNHGIAEHHAIGCGGSNEAVLFQPDRKAQAA